MKREEKYNVLIADDHALFRTGLKSLLQTLGICGEIYEASDGQQFIALLDVVKPDVVLLDIDMPILDGMEAAKRAFEIYPDLNIVTLSMHGEQDYYFRMVSLGVKGFILKSSEIEEVEAAIQTVGKGGSYFSQELLQSLVASLRTVPREEDEKEELSLRELEILLLICRGLSNQEIADQLFISKRTVDKHRSNILSKTNCKNTANLVVYAIKNSMVEI